MNPFSVRKWIYFCPENGFIFVPKMNPFCPEIVYIFCSEKDFMLSWNGITFIMKLYIFLFTCWRIPPWGVGYWIVSCEYSCWRSPSWGIESLIVYILVGAAHRGFVGYWTLDPLRNGASTSEQEYIQLSIQYITVGCANKNTDIHN